VRRVGIAAAVALTLVLLQAGALDWLGPAPGVQEGAKPSPDGAAPDHVLHLLPGWPGVGGITFGRQIFLSRSQQTGPAIGHELVHVRQQAAHPVWFWVSYLLLPRWRLRWEAEAYAVQARARCPIDGDHGLAAYLSGPAYLWPASRAEAAAAIRVYLGVPALVR
jgi:hypothetical protein